MSGIMLLATGCSTTRVSMAPSGDPSTVGKLGADTSLMQQGEYRQAIADMERQVSRSSGMMDTRINLAIAYRKLKQYSEAESHLRKVLDSEPENAVAWHQWAIVKREQGEFGEAESAYQHALDIDPNYALVHRNYGILLDLYLQKPVAALPHYRQYIALDGENSEEVNRWVVDLERRVNQ